MLRCADTAVCAYADHWLQDQQATHQRNEMMVSALAGVIPVMTSPKHTSLAPDLHAADTVWVQVIMHCDSPQSDACVVFVRRFTPESQTGTEW